MRGPTEVAYRDNPIPLCHLCQSREVVATCLRCGGPLCVQHLPSCDGHRYVACERSFLAGRSRHNTKIAITGVALAAGTVAAFLTAGAAAGFFGVMLTGALPASTGAISHSVARRRFLRQRSESSHQVTLGDRDVAIAPRSEGDATARCTLSPRRIAHSPDVPLERRPGPNS
jgi:hypothetical protein